MIHFIVRFILVLGILLGTTLQGQEVWNLQDCIHYTIQNHPLIQQTNLNENTTTWQVKQAKGNLLPAVNAQINHSYSLGSTINPNTNSRESLNVQYDQFAVNVGMDLFHWQRYLNIQLQKMNQGSFVHRLAATKNQLILEVVQNFYAYQNAKAWRGVLETQIAGIDEQIVRTEKEVKIGVRPKSDIYDIKANMGNIQEQYIDGKKMEQWTKLNLLQTINLKNNSLEFVVDSDELVLLMPPKEDLKLMIDAQPKIRELHTLVEVAEQKIKVNKAAALPSLSGVYQWSTFYSKILNGDNATAFSDQLDLNKNQYIGLGLNIPIFNKMQVKTKIEMAKIKKDLQILNLKKAQQETWTALHKIIDAFEKSVEKYSYIQDNFENQRLSFVRSKEKFNEGLIDAYTFFIIRNNWLSANYNLIQSKNEVLMQQELLRVYGAE